MRNYELMVILDPNLDERTVTPSLETFLRVVTGDGGSVEKIEVWGKRRMAYEIRKHAEGVYAVLEVTCEPATVAELDRQLTLNESVLRTKVMRREPAKVSSGSGSAGADAAPSAPSATPAASGPRPGGSGPRPSAPRPTPSGPRPAASGSRPSPSGPRPDASPTPAPAPPPSMPPAPAPSAPTN